MVHVHLRPEIALESLLDDTTRTILQRLRLSLKQNQAEGLFVGISRAVRAALARHLFRNEMCSLSATSREGEPGRTGSGAAHNPLYLKGDGEFKDLLRDIASTIWTDLNRSFEEHQRERAYREISEALRSVFDRSLITYETCGLSLYGVEGEVRVLAEAE